MSLKRNNEGHITADKHGRAQERQRVFGGRAGKGDKRRPEDPVLLELGWLITYGETEEIRAQAKKDWYKARGITPKENP